MYKVLARLPVPSALPTAEEFVSQEVERMRSYAQRIGVHQAGFLSLGMSMPDVQSQIDEIVAHESITDRGIDDALSERLSCMVEEGTARLVDDPDAFATSALEAIRQLLDDGGTIRSISARSDGGKPGSTLSRTVHPEASMVSLTMHMEHEEDYWFVEPRVMRQMLADMVAIWDPDWVSAFPSMYAGTARQLFPDRMSFGWMGYTRQKLESGYDVLARVEPLLEGTFLMLSETVMTMSDADISACNRAEAFLVDKGILPSVQTGPR